MNYSNKSNVVHLTSAHPRFDTRIFIKQCTSLATIYNTFLIVSDGLGDDIVNNVIIKDIGKFSTRAKRLLYAPYGILQAALILNADVYHIHDPELIPIGMILKRKGKIVIFDAHEDLPKQILSKHYIHRLLRKPVSAIFKHLEIISCSHFDAIIAATPIIKNKFKQINKVTVDINNYPKLEEFKVPKPIEKVGNQICYVGGLATTRGINEMMQAMLMTKNDINLVVAGSFVTKVLQNKIINHLGWKKVNYLGFVDREIIKETLASSVAGLVVLHPTASYQEALPVKMFEYMGSGIPVIASNFTLWRSIIDTIGCGLCVDPLNPSSIAQAIDYLVDNPKIAEEMGDKGQKAVYDRYNWNIEEQKLFNLYGLLLTTNKDKICS